MKLDSKIMTDRQTQAFLEKLEKLPQKTQLCIGRLLSEINEVGLIHIGGCPWREPYPELLESMPALKELAPSVHIIKHTKEGKVVMYGIRWTYCEFYMPNCFHLQNLWDEITQKVQAQRGKVDWTVMI